MKIVNDKIEIEASDIAEFSPDVQQALAWRAGEQVTAHEYFSARFNAVVEEAVNTHNKDRLEKGTAVFLVFAKADVQTQDSVKRVLGLLPPEELKPATEDVVAPSLLSRAVNFFTGN